jgi:transcriptional regulator with XRE-family HTH domain
MFTELDTRKSVGQRLQRFREDAGLSRRQLAELVDDDSVTAKTIENIERVVTDPGVNRLKAIAEALMTDIDTLLGEKPTQPTQPGGVITEAPAEAPAEMPTDYELALEALEELDDLRKMGFQEEFDHANNLVQDAQNALKRVDVEELCELARQRKISPASHPDSDEFKAMIGKNVQGYFAQRICLAERIIDTAVLGVDLYKIEPKALEKLGDELCNRYKHLKGCKEHFLYPFDDLFRFFGWFKERDPNSEDVIIVIREPIRAEHLSEAETAPDFSDAKRFPRAKKTLVSQVGIEVEGRSKRRL